LLLQVVEQVDMTPQVVVVQEVSHILLGNH
jgi:hypothetical protein